jgi:DNA-binding response OmpR family regulator
MRVLIAEDSAVDRIMLRRIIEGLGHECLLASTGKEAWELSQAEPPDVLISDWMMPGMNGPELCRRIRSQPGAPYTYVILLTVLDDHEHTRHGMQAGADDYLRKPLDIHELELRLINAERVVTLHRWLSRRDEQREQTLERNESLLRLAERIVAETDAEQLLTVLLSEATDLTGGSAGEISLWDEAASSLVSVRSSVGGAAEVATAAQMAAQRAAQRQAPLILDDPQFRATHGEGGIGALATPLVHDDRLLGRPCRPA